MKAPGGGAPAAAARAVCLIIGLLGCHKTTSGAPTHPDAGVRQGLREDILRGSAARFHVTSQSGMWGVMVELGAPEGPATLVALVDGSARLALPGGVGVIADGGHARVRAGAARLCELATKAKGLTTPTDDFRWPKEGWVRIFLLTDDGVRVAEAEANRLDDGRHPLSPVFLVGNDLVTKLRLASAGTP